MKATRVCSFPDCGAELVAQGLCSGHRRQMKRGQELEPIDRTPRPEVCTFPACGKPNHVLGLCHGHRRQLANDQPLTPIIRRGERCSVQGCDSKHSALGYCAVHYRRFKVNGHPEHLLKIMDPHERFDAYTEKTDTCWLWTGALTYDGYGMFRHDNRIMGAHRWAYEIAVGPIPRGLQIDHLCRVRNCVRPDHLEPVTNAENTRRAYAARKLTPRRTA